MEIKRLLVAGDTHGDIVHCRYLSVTAARLMADAVFIVGDFGYWEHMGDGVEFLDQLDAIAIEAGVPFYFCDGNHDKTSMLIEKYGDKQDPEGFLVVRPYVRYAGRGHRWTWANRRFIALGGAYSVDKPYRLQWGMQWFPEEEMTDEDMAAILAADSSKVDVMFTHDKPRSSNPGWNRKDFPECWPNQDRIQLALMTLQPTLLVHGHLHFRYEQDVRSGSDTWTTVLGLNCNSRDQDGVVTRGGYSKPGESSWVLLDLEENPMTWGVYRK